MSVSAPPLTLTIPCGYCGKSVTRKWWEVRPSGRAFCTRDCAARARGAAENLSVTLICPCGTEFQAKRSRSAAKYCSVSCRSKLRPTPAPKPESAVKFGRTRYPTKPAPKIEPAAWTWPVENSAMVACARCGRERARGVRCICERVEIAP